MVRCAVGVLWRLRGVQKTRYGERVGCGLLADYGGVFTVQGVSLCAGAADIAGVRRRAGIAVRVAGRQFCQLLDHVKRIQHQLRHVNAAGTDPYHWRDNLLLYGRNAFANLANLLRQVHADRNGGVFGYGQFIISADRGQSATLNRLAKFLPVLTC